VIANPGTGYASGTVAASGVPVASIVPEWVPGYECALRRSAVEGTGGGGMRAEA